MGFFDKIKEQASSLGSQLDQALDGTKQKGQINTMRKQRGEMVAQLGESLLEQFRQQNVNAEALSPQVEQIFNLEREIIDAEQQIEAQKQAAAQAAATAPPPPGQAAAPQQPPAPPAPPAAPAPPQAPQAAAAGTCSSCGSEIPEGSAFCQNCGTNVGG